MSRIGKAPVTLPAGVEFKVDDNNLVTIKGPKGELSQQIDPDLKVSLNEGDIIFERPTEQKRHKAMHGLYRSLVANMVTGVSEGYTKKLELVGVGYRANAQGQKLELQVGYSHPIIMIIPKEVKVTSEAEKGKSPAVILESNDKQLIGQIAAKIRSFRKPEPYKGKGIKYSDEVIRRKAGKAAAKA